MPRRPRSAGAYVSIGLAAQAPQDARFADGADDGHAPLYGRPELFTSGEFGAAFLSNLAAGYRFTPRLRFQVEIGMARPREYRGTANYARAGAVQPSSADLGTRQLLAAGFYDIAVWRIGPVLRIEPYVGAGAGFTYYRLDNFVQRFPDPDDAAGYLRRGAAGEVPFTGLPTGSGRSATGMVTAGLAVPVAARVRFDLAYRYTDAGSVGTAAGGDILIVRYNRGVPVGNGGSHQRDDRRLPHARGAGYAPGGFLTFLTRSSAYAIAFGVLWSVPGR